MEIGDRVIVVKLLSVDKEHTDLKKGDIGTVVNISDIDNDVYGIRFCRVIKHDVYNWNCNNDTYDMYKWQLEVIKESDDELEQYKKIGTLEECRVAMEKQKDKKPILCNEQAVRYALQYNCPSCGGGFTGTGMADYCYHCGQKLDWGSEGE